MTSNPYAVPAFLRYPIFRFASEHNGVTVDDLTAGRISGFGDSCGLNFSVAILNNMVLDGFLTRDVSDICRYVLTDLGHVSLTGEHLSLRVF